MKPNKILYENQEQVLMEATGFLLSLLSECHSVKTAYIWASLAEGKFGVYEELYRGQTCSDIDLVIVVDEPFVLPKKWNFTKVSKSWFDLYFLGYFEYNGNRHQIDGLIVIPSKHNMNKMYESLDCRSKLIYNID